MNAPTLIAAAHGTRDGRDRATVEALLDRVRALRPYQSVRAAYLQFSQPSVAGALTEVDGPAVVVPLLLSTGYHARVDLPEAIRDAQTTTAGRHEFLLGSALGPHPLLVQALTGRLHAAGWQGDMPLVLAAAGSSDPRATADVQAMARSLARSARVPVVAGFASGTTPTIAEAVRTLRDRGADQVAVAVYLIAPGQFHDLAAAAGADLIAAPLADHPAMARLLLHRYDAALNAAAAVCA